MPGIQASFPGSGIQPSRPAAKGPQTRFGQGVVKSSAAVPKFGMEPCSAIVCGCCAPIALAGIGGVGYGIKKLIDKISGNR